MEKYTQNAYKINQKIPLKNKLLMKSIMPEKAELMVVRFNQEDSMAACGYTDGYVRVFNLGTDNKISEINTAGKETGPVNSIRWRPINEHSNSMSPILLVGNTNGHLYQYVAKTGKQIFHTFEEGNYIMALDYAPDGRAFITAGKDNIIRIYDQETKKVKSTLQGVTWHKSGHNNRLFSVKVKKDEPDIIVSGGWDQNVNIWDQRTGNVISTIYGPKIAGDSLDIRQNILLTGANRGQQQLQLWDWRENKLIHTYKWDQFGEDNSGFIFCAQFCNNNKNVVLAVGGNDLKFFTLDDYSQILEVNMQKSNSLYSCDSGYTGTKFLTGGKSGSLYFFGSNKTFE